MSKLTNIATVIATVAGIFSTALPAQARPIADSTGVQVLKGVRTKADVVGGKVEALEGQIQNQGGYGVAWTTYFAGQRKCVRSPGIGGFAWLDSSVCATINADGTVTLAGERTNWVIAQLPAPHELSNLSHSLYDPGSDYSQSRTFYWYLYPSRDGRLNLQVRGETPNNWVLQFRDQNGALYSSW